MSIERRRLRVYLAGPMSSGDRFENITGAIRVARKMVQDGLAPYVPQFDAYMFPGEDITWNGFLEWDMEWVAVSEAVYRLAGESKGADLECLKASERGIPVFYQFNHDGNPSPLWGYMKMLEYAESQALTGVRR